VANPNLFHSELIPLTNHLLTGARPTAVISVAAAFLALSTQLGILICWYRAQCKLDFGGRYRVRPWVVGLTGMAAFCLATNTHRAFGEVVGRSEWLPWRGPTVAWLLPFCVAALPITLLLDRDIRNSRSSLYTLRFSGMLWLAGACLELYQPELQSKPWFHFAQMLVPLFASATLFVGLWLHARIVAYVCPDPPELDEQSAWSLMMVVLGWFGRRLMFWRRSEAAVPDDDEDEKPKRRRKKADGEETATKRKRKAPARRTSSRTRTRTKTDEEETEEPSGEMANEESESVNEPVDESPEQDNSSWSKTPEPSYDEPDELPPAAPPVPATKGNDRFTQIHKSHGSAVPAPLSRRQSPSWEDEPEPEKEAAPAISDSSEDADEDRQFQLDSGMTNDQMKGLSKRQKRELKKQLRDQERARGR